MCTPQPQLRKLTPWSCLKDLENICLNSSEIHLVLGYTRPYRGEALHTIHPSVRKDVLSLVLPCSGVTDPKLLNSRQIIRLFSLSLAKPDMKTLCARDALIVHKILLKCNILSAYNIMCSIQSNLYRVSQNSLDILCMIVPFRSRQVYFTVWTWV